MPPLTKTCPKMVPSHKGGSLCVKDAFAKKFFYCREIPLAARSHRFFGNTLLKAGHLMRSSVVVSGTVLQGGQELVTSLQNDSPSSRGLAARCSVARRWHGRWRGGRQQPAMPVQQASQGHGSPCFAGFRQGLNEIGYVEGRICSQHIVCCITPHDRFIGELNLPLADCA